MPWGLDCKNCGSNLDYEIDEFGNIIAIILK